MPAKKGQRTEVDPDALECQEVPRAEVDPDALECPEVPRAYPPHLFAWREAHKGLDTVDPRSVARVCRNTHCWNP